MFPKLPTPSYLPVNNSVNQIIVMLSIDKNVNSMAFYSFFLRSFIEANLFLNLITQLRNYR